MEISQLGHNPHRGAEFTERENGPAPLLGVKDSLVEGMGRTLHLDS